MVALRPRDPNDVFQRALGMAKPAKPVLAQDAAPSRQRTGDKALAPVRPNLGIEAAYRRKLQALVAEMAASFNYWMKAAYRANEPAIAQDATPAAELQAAFEKLAKRWRGRFKDAAPELAEYFATAASRRSTAALQAILKRGGYSVEFKTTPALRDIIRATVEQNVQLIKSIPEEYLTQVQGEVMRSVQAGRDLAPLAQALENQYGVTKGRAAFIARSQNNMATAAITRARQEQAGIIEADWSHSGGGKEPRPTHVANNGKRYDVAKGWYDPQAYKVKGGGFRGAWIWPGQLLNCRCVSRARLPGLSR